MDEELKLSVPSGALAAAGALTGEEQLVLRQKLWRLLGKRVERYTTGDSGSVPVETAQELLESICYTLDLALRTEGLAPRTLLTEPLDALLARGQQEIGRLLTQCESLLHQACAGAPDISNRSLQDTLRSIGGLRRRYDYWLFAHPICCDIDYQLCRPVPESLRGAEYVAEYLRRIIAENGVLALFDPQTAVRLLQRYCPDYEGLLINLCEPVFTNAVGLLLAGRPPLPLRLTDEDLGRLDGLFSALSASAGRRALEDAARRFCRECGVTDGYTRAYLRDVAADLWPRIAAARDFGGLAGIFIPF